MQLERWWQQRRQGAWRMFFLLASLLYGVGYFSRRVWLWLTGVSAQAIGGATIISVGNLSAGGSGKTPAALAVAAHFLAKDRKVFFLNRGYGRRSGREPQLVSAGGETLANFEEAGDEALLLAQSAPGAGVIVDRDRVRAGRQAVSQHGAQVLILDDGFQQRLFCQRHLDLLLFDSREMHALQLLPAGVLREPLQEGRQADALLFSHCSSRPEAEKALAYLPEFYRQKRIFWSWHQAEALRVWGSKQSIPLKRLSGMKVGAVAGIAKPERFRTTLEELGALVQDQFWFSDHHAYGLQELQEVVGRAKSQGLKALITTEKDAVRFPENLQLELPLWILKISMQIRPRAAFAALLNAAERRAKLSQPF